MCHTKKRLCWEVAHTFFSRLRFFSATCFSGTTSSLIMDELLEHVLYLSHKQGSSVIQTTHWMNKGLERANIYPLIMSAGFNSKLICEEYSQFYLRGHSSLWIFTVWIPLACIPMSKNGCNKGNPFQLTDRIVKWYSDRLVWRRVK